MWRFDKKELTITEEGSVGSVDRIRIVARYICRSSFLIQADEITLVVGDTSSREAWNKPRPFDSSTRKSAPLSGQRRTFSAAGAKRQATSISFFALLPVKISSNCTEVTRKPHSPSAKKDLRRPTPFSEQCQVRCHPHPHLHDTTPASPKRNPQPPLLPPSPPTQPPVKSKHGDNR